MVEKTGHKVIGSTAIGRALNAMEGFSRLMEDHSVRTVHAVATGAVREAHNRDEILGRIYERTGILVRPISGSEEALLTGKGVREALNIRAGPYLIFDLGGGSTEFLLGRKEGHTVRSIPLGALALTREFLISDPPKEEELEALSGRMDEALRQVPGADPDSGPLTMAGTGGTVTTLGAMLHAIPVEDISPERMNGLILERRQLDGLSREMRNLSLDQRARLPGLDRERADVILAGVLLVMRILDFFQSPKLVVSLSDLLEGLLIDHGGSVWMPPSQ
jgi:exopolyphosphatase/guanosine-5'-triphosphate,3'-diphosphate pyrophosphatase